MRPMWNGGCASSGGCDVELNPGPAPPQLTVDGLTISVAAPGGRVEVVQGVSFELQRGEIVGLVGESGCGKSLTAMAVLGLTSPGASIEGGRVLLDGRDLLSSTPAELRRARGGSVGLVLQEAMSALDPVATIGAQLQEVLRLHRGLDRGRAAAEARRLLRLVAMPDGEERLRQYPHELSGGLRQRAMLAIALAGGPSLLVADEPTTALDVTVQAELLGSLQRLRRDCSLTILLITHDLSVVAEICDRVLVMYCGEIVEQAPVLALFDSPAHPYTRGLLKAAPRLGQPGERGRLPAIAGSVPRPQCRPLGCSFEPRCGEAWARCAEQQPPSYALGPGRAARCFLHDEAIER